MKMKGLLSASLILLSIPAISAMRGNVETVEPEPLDEEAKKDGDLLVAAAADSEEEDIRKLHEAARSGNIEDTIMLLEKGVSINAADEDGLIPLTMATQGNEGQKADKLEVAEFLWNKHKVQFDSLLLEISRALSRQRLPQEVTQCIILNYVLTNGYPYAKMNFKRYHPIKTRGYDVALAWEAVFQGCMTPLQESAKSGDIDAVKAFLAAGEFVDQTSYSKSKRSVSLALKNDHVEVLKLLAEKGANIEKKSRNYSDFIMKLTPLSAAAADGRRDIVRALVALLKSEDGTIAGGTQALKAAMRFRNAKGESNAEIVRFLIEQGVRDKKGLIPTAYLAANAD